MKRNVFAALAVFVLLAVASSSAYAKPVGGRVGIGADSTLGFSNQFLGIVSPPGFSVVYGVSDGFTVQGIIGTQFASGTDERTGGGVNLTFASTILAARAHLVLVDYDNVNLNGFVGAGVVFESLDSTSSADEDISATFFNAELGIRPEVFFGDHFSVHTQIGVSVSVLNASVVENADDARYPLDSGVSFNILRIADLWGSAGFTFWF